jgi:hypothetical protein
VGSSTSHNPIALRSSAACYRESFTFTLLIHLKCVLKFALSVPLTKEYVKRIRIGRGRLLITVETCDGWCGTLGMRTGKELS